MKHQYKSSYEDTSSNQNASSLKKESAWCYEKLRHPTEKAKSQKIAGNKTSIASQVRKLANMHDSRYDVLVTHMLNEKKHN